MGKVMQEITGNVRLKKPTIGIDGHMLGDHSGGNESYYKNILLNMQVPRGWEIYLFLKPGVDASLFEDRFKIVRFISGNAAERNLIELPMLAHRLKLDLLHTQYFIPFNRPCPVVCTIHDICFEHYKDIFTRSEYIRQKVLVPYAAKKAKKIFTVSEFSKSDISKAYGIPSERIHVTWNAVNEHFGRMAEPWLGEIGLRRKFGIGDAPYILTVGNLQPRKNLPRLIEAFKRLKSQNGTEGNHHGYKLVIVGKKAWMYENILQLADREDIVLTDYVTESDLIKLYNAAELFVYPSIFEGFGLPPLEAMACGTPVAVSETSSLPEVVGNAGMYFDPFDVESIKTTLQKMLTDQDLRECLAERGFEQVKRFSWTGSAQRIIDTYRSILEDR